LPSKAAAFRQWRRIYSNYHFQNNFKLTATDQICTSTYVVPLDKRVSSYQRFRHLNWLQLDHVDTRSSARHRHCITPDLSSVYRACITLRCFPHWADIDAVLLWLRTAFTTTPSYSIVFPRYTSRRTS